MKVTQRVRYGSRGQGSLIKFAGSAMWFSYYFHAGTEHCESTKQSDLKLARRVHKRILDELAAHRGGHKKFLAPMDSRLTTGQLLDALDADCKLRKKDSPSFRSRVKPIREHFGAWRAVDVTDEAIDVYIESRLEAEMSPATVNRETQLLGQAFRLAFGRKRLASMPNVRHLKETNVRQGFFERDEFERLVAALPAYLQDVARFAYLCGWRRGEILSLKWTDVDRPGRVIRLRPEESKNGHGRTVTIDGDLAALMERRYQARLLEGVRVADLVFHNEGAAIVDFRKAWASACVAAGLYYVDGKRKVPEKLFHDLRRTAVRDMVRAGVPERVAMNISGHLSRNVFDRYNIVSETDLRDAMQKRQAYARA